MESLSYPRSTETGATDRAAVVAGVVGGEALQGPGRTSVGDGGGWRGAHDADVRAAANSEAVRWHLIKSALPVWHLEGSEGIAGARQDDRRMSHEKTVHSSVFFSLFSCN